MTANLKLFHALRVAIGCGVLVFAAAPQAQAKETVRASAASITEMAAADGLVPVKDSVLAHAWIRPGVDLRRYHNLMVLPVTVKSGEARSLSDDCALTTMQLHYLQGVLSAEVQDEVAKLSNYQLTEQRPIRGLVLDVAVVDVISHVAPESVGRGATFSRSLGTATLAFELRDATTNVVLARAVERRDISNQSLHRSNRAWNQSEVRRAAQRFGEDVKRQIEEFTAASPRAVASS